MLGLILHYLYGHCKIMGYVGKSHLSHLKVIDGSKEMDRQSQ